MEVRWDSRTEDLTIRMDSMVTSSITIAKTDGGIMLKTKCLQESIRHVPHEALYVNLNKQNPLCAGCDSDPIMADTQTEDDLVVVDPTISILFTRSKKNQSNVSNKIC
ncbi:hypothetical protein Tcan_17260 [Toxocara canis]|uniref:Uncharacterized protein n=1 Tax=Toxocara canis TaxID=6265 RepID=A0A0B2V0B4_TOXCA|nr:hypothetical protein Tcan_17260 [Toxocara canis]